jgi:hypothetical protein
MPENDSPQLPTPISRRHFARQAALAAVTTATAATLPAGLLGSSAPETPAELTQQAPPPLKHEAHEEIVCIHSAISRKYGRILSKEQLDDIQLIIQQDYKGIVRLRFFPLDNDSQPALVLRIFPPGPTPPATATHHHPPNQPSEAPALKPVARQPKD